MAGFSGERDVYVEESPYSTLESAFSLVVHEIWAVDEVIWEAETLEMIGAVVSTGAFTIKVKIEVFVTDPAVVITVIVEFPVGVEALAEIVSVVEQLGEQAVGENDAAAPVGRPETVNPVDWVVPEERVAVTVLVTELPWVTDLFPPLERVKLKVIGAVTFTVTDWLAVPPVPMQVSVKVELVVRLPVDWEPEIDLVPDHAPEAVQEVALVEDQERVEPDPEVTEVGLAVMETVGAGVGTVYFSK